MNKCCNHNLYYKLKLVNLDEFLELPRLLTALLQLPIKICQSSVLKSQKNPLRIEWFALLDLKK